MSQKVPHVAGCRFVKLILSVSNLNRQPATSCQFPIRWTCLYRIGNWIGNRQLVASCRFVELIFSVSNLNRQASTSCRLVELVCIESATESATDNWLPVADSLNLSVSNRQLNRQLVADSLNLYCLFRIWIGNRQLVASFRFVELFAGCRFVELILSVLNLNRQPATGCPLPIRWTCLYRIGNWIGNWQLVAHRQQ